MKERRPCEFCRQLMPGHQKDSVCTRCDKALEKAFKANQPVRPLRKCRICAKAIEGANYFFCTPCHTATSAGFEDHAIGFQHNKNWKQR